MKPTISIVTAYFNRKKQFLRTLQSIALSTIQDIEIIVVDDGSGPEHAIDDCPRLFPQLRLSKIPREHRWYRNPCIPFNIAIQQARGDIIVLQNPECLHLGDVLRDIVERINDRDYLTYSCYSLDETTTESLADIPFDHQFEEAAWKLISPTQDIPCQVGRLSWYNHPLHRPAPYHFCSAMLMANMRDLGGFDPRFGNGISFDDIEFLWRVRRKGLNARIVERPLVLHQWHYGKDAFPDWTDPSTSFYRQKNEDLLHGIVARETGWRVAI